MSSDIQDTPDAPTPQKPRLALMGEFSAGKSTLSNLLLGADPLPVRVTATRLPPIWISYGDAPACREDMEGNLIPFDMADLEAVKLEETRLIRLYLKSDVLQLCDLIDMPGISDPNMASDVWQSVIGEADHILWCTLATQAWRQSESAVWESLPEHLHDKSLLLLTRFDKILSLRDQTRLLSRVRRETKGLFSDMFPISLTKALVAGEDRDAWAASGADAFVTRLIDLLMSPNKSPTETAGTYDTATAQTSGDSAPPRARDLHTQDGPAPAQESVRVMPSRVRQKSRGQRRPRCAATPIPDQTAASPLAEMTSDA